MRIGVLMLDTTFERHPGDAGHPATWPSDTLIRVVRGASVSEVVDRQGMDVVDLFIDAGRDLVRRGCHLVTTSCGFMAQHQAKLAEALDACVVTSSLVQLGPLLQSVANYRKVGVLTFDSWALLAAPNGAVTFDRQVAVEGLDPDGRFAAHIRGRRACGYSEMRAETLAAARGLLAQEPAVSILLLECTNMSPFADALRSETGLPVFDLLTAVHAARATMGRAAQRQDAPA